MNSNLTAEQIVEKRHNELLEIEKIESQRKIGVFYSERLSFLWEQYNKLMNLGLIASTGTMVFLIQAILINKDAREVIAESTVTLNSQWFAVSILFAAIAAISFVASRWCSQILMERQVYGSHTDAINYFKNTLGGETMLPTALEIKKYIRIKSRVKFLSVIGWANELAKWSGIAFILVSWVYALKYFWPLIKTLQPLSK